MLILKIVNMVFAVLFTIEMLLKWVAFGLWRYFTSAWTCLDFVIVCVSISWMNFTILSQRYKDKFLILQLYNFTFCIKIGFNLKFGNWRKCKSNCIAFTSNSSCFETIEGYIKMARHENRRKCLDVCHSVHYQCVIGMLSVLVDFLYHGCSIFWREILQMRWCGWRKSSGWYSQRYVRIFVLYLVWLQFNLLMNENERLY